MMKNFWREYGKLIVGILMISTGVALAVAYYGHCASGSC